MPVTEPDEIRANLIAQLTSPVRWTQTIQKMVADGATEFIESGPGAVLQGLVRKINPDVSVSSIELLIA
jgi:[acyl-carrier-protein] S-malonyltransferase